MASTEDQRFGVDDNNNAAKYSLRPRTTQRVAAEVAEETSKIPAESPERPQKPKRSRRDKQHPPLSKYRRKTANARERSRMREINEAFEALRRAVPRVQEESGEKATKISTLRLAMEYISALHRALGDSEESLLGDSEGRHRTPRDSDYRALGDSGGATEGRFRTFRDSGGSFSPLGGSTESYPRDSEGRFRTLRDSDYRALGDTTGTTLPTVTSKPYQVSNGCLSRPSSTGDFADLSLSPTLETTDQSLSSSASDVSDLFLISLDLDPGPLRAFAALDQCLDEVLFDEGLS